MNKELQLKDPRKFTNLGLKKNILIDSANFKQKQLLSDNIYQYIISNQEKQVSVAINLAPSAEIANTINKELINLFINKQNYYFVFALPLLLIADNNHQHSHQLSNLEILNLLTDYGAVYIHPNLQQDLNNIGLLDLYLLQQKQSLDEIILWMNQIKQNYHFSHQSSSNQIKIKYILGVSLSSDIFKPQIIETLGLKMMNLINSPKHNNDHYQSIYIPLFIDSIIAAVNKSRFFFFESIFNLEISDSVKNIKIDNNSSCYAQINTETQDTAITSIILKLYKKPLANIFNNKKSNILIKELRWPLTNLDNFDHIIARIYGLLSYMQVTVSLKE